MDFPGELPKRRLLPGFYPGIWQPDEYGDREVCRRGRGRGGVHAVRVDVHLRLCGVPCPMRGRRASNIGPLGSSDLGGSQDYTHSTSSRSRSRCTEWWIVVVTFEWVQRLDESFLPSRVLLVFPGRERFGQIWCSSLSRYETRAGGNRVKIRKGFLQVPGSWIDGFPSPLLLNLSKWVWTRNVTLSLGRESRGKGEWR